MRRTAVIVILMCVLAPSIVRAAEWYEKLKLKGDVRFRNELIQQESKGDNFRWRMRARLTAEAEINESWSVVLGLATGSDDPVSTNQTLTGGFSKKAFNLDLAYVDFHPKSLAGLRVNAGKMGLPFETADKTQLVWDNDLSPEGVALRYRRAAGDRINLFMNAAGFYISDSDPDNEQWMSGGQAGFVVKASDDLSLTAGAGYFEFLRAKGMPMFYNSSKNYGNSGTKVVVDEKTTYYYTGEYQEVEILGFIDAKVNERMSLRLTGDYVKNTGADDMNSAYLFGGSLSHGKDRGALKVLANYRSVEADAVVGAFSNSDFLGGGTNGKGWELGCSVGLAKGASLDLTYLLNTKGIKEGEPGLDYKRLQVDIQAKF